MAAQKADVQSNRSCLENVKNIMKSLSCSVCMDIITDPCSLECIHSFCESCMTGLPKERQQGQSVICCPLCHNVTFEKDIKQNTAMKTIAKWYEKNSHLFENLSQHGKLIAARTCLSCETLDVKNFCVNCNKEICINCSGKHDQNHQIKHDLKTIVEEPPIEINLPLSCSKHLDKQVTHNCNNCEVLICQACLDSDHRDHYFEDIDAANSRCIPMVRDYLDKIDENMLSLQNAITSVQNQWHNAKNNREKLRKQILAEQAKKIKQINQDTEKLIQQLVCQDQQEVQEIKSIQKDLHNNFSCQESLRTWCDVIMNISKGPGLFHELNYKLYTKVAAYANEPLNLESSKFDLTDYSFKPSTLENINLVGTTNIECDVVSVEEITSEQVEHGISDPSNVHPPPKRRSSSFIESRRRPSLLAHIRRASLYESRPGKQRLFRQQYTYRSTSINLSMLHSHDIEEVGNFKLDKLSQRMCFFNGKFWFPCFEEKDSCIDVYQDCRLINSFKYDGIVGPHSIQPINNSKLAIAANNGLFLINADGLYLSQILQGQFTEVSADENYIIAVEKVSDNVQNIKVLHNNHATQKNNSFTITDTNVDTVLLHRNRIYISLYQEDKISKIVKYSITGEKLTDLGQHGRLEEGSLNLARMCAADVNGSILVADCNNCRLQVADSKAKWTIIKQAVGYPWDVVIADDGFIYILCGLYQYGYVQKCKIC